MYISNYLQLLLFRGFPPCWLCFGQFYSHLLLFHQLFYLPVLAILLVLFQLLLCFAACLHSFPEFYWRDHKFWLMLILDLPRLRDPLDHHLRFIAVTVYPGEQLFMVLEGPTGLAGAIIFSGLAFCFLLCLQIGKNAGFFGRLGGGLEYRCRHVHLFP